MVDAIVKMLLVLLGALVGCVLTRYLAKRRLRRLVPLAIAQLKSGVLQCQMAFTMDEAKFAGLVLDSAYRFASEVISSEFEEAQWREAAQLIQEIQTAISAVATGGPKAVPNNTAKLREVCQPLAEWLAKYA